MLPPHVLVFYDPVTLKPLRVVVNEDGEDGTWMVEMTDVPDGEARAVIPKSEVRGKNFYRMAEAAILKKEGKSPPLPDGV